MIVMKQEGHTTLCTVSGNCLSHSLQVDETRSDDRLYEPLKETIAFEFMSEAERSAGG